MLSMSIYPAGLYPKLFFVPRGVTFFLSSVFTFGDILSSVFTLGDILSSYSMCI